MLTPKERQNLRDDLHGVVSGEVLTSEIYSQLYSTDASLYEIQPAAIVRPVSVNDVVHCVKYAAENDLSVTPRGAGTGLAGESLNQGIILDFSHSMRKILSVDAETVSVQPGVVLGNLNRHLERYGKLVGPDPATRNVTTIGGMIGVDAAGSHWLKYGSTRHKVKGMQVVLADGEIIETSETHFHSVEYNRFRKSEIVSDLEPILAYNKELIQSYHRPELPGQSGYNLFDVSHDKNNRIDLNPLLVGAEGTLGIVTAATFETDPIPAARGVVAFFFERLERATSALSLITEQQPVACDLLDRRLLNITRETDPDLAGMIPALAENMLLVELDGDDESEVSDRLDLLIRKVQRQHGLAFHSVATTHREERNRLWRIVRRVITRLSRVSSWVSSAPFVEDMVVPPNRLHDFIMTAQKILRSHNVTASVFSHAGYGRTSIRPFLDMSDQPRLRSALRSVSRELFDLALDCGGSISANQGDGLSRSYFLEKQYGKLYSVFQDVKQVFDPDSRLNPGKIVGMISHSPDNHLRRPFQQTAGNEQGDSAGSAGNINSSTSSTPNPETTVVQIGNGFQPSLPWTTQEIAETVQSCNGCGRCRTAQPHERMCPIFRMLPGEEASPRAKANMMRGVLSGELPTSIMGSEEFKEIADLCVNCHQCRRECPAEVDIPKLMLEAKSQFASQNGLGFSQALMSRLDLLCKLGSRFSWTTNILNRSRWFRWLLEKTTGIAQGRKLPKFATNTFLSKAYWKKLTTPKNNPGDKVAYFVDAIPNWVDIELSDALLHVMERNDIEVYVPPSQQFSGLSLISNGVIEKAIKVARKNVEIFAEAIRAGYHVVTTEPAAALCLSNEYRNILGDDDDTRLVAENSSEVCHYLWNLHRNNRLDVRFDEIDATIGYHWPCHQKALSTDRPGVELMKLIPKLNVVHIDKGCSGMAGTFGLMKKNFRKSLRAGWSLISELRTSEMTLGATECSACKIQMEQGTTKPTFHPLKILAHAYGFLPDLADRMLKPNDDRFVSR